MSLHVHVLHTCRHMAEKSGVHHLSGYQLQTDGQFQRKCVSLLRKWEEWSVKDVHWTQLPRKCAGKWLQKNQEGLSLIHSCLLTDTSGCSWGPSLLNTPLTHAIHSHYTAHKTNRKHTTNTYIYTPHIHTTQKQNPQIITYLQLLHTCKSKV